MTLTDCFIQHLVNETLQLFFISLSYRNCRNQGCSDLIFMATCIYIFTDAVSSFGKEK